MSVAPKTVPLPGDEENRLYSHPEEMRASFDLRIGIVSLQGTARMTPAGVATIGIAAGAVLLTLSVLIRAIRSPRSS